MKVERSYLVRIVQTYEGEPPAEWFAADEAEGSLIEYGYLDGEQDEYVCNNWECTTDQTELLDNDELETRILK